jgi:hypothetical protein
MKRKEAYERSQALKRIQEETERARELVAQRAQLQVPHVMHLLGRREFNRSSSIRLPASQSLACFYHCCECNARALSADASSAASYSGSMPCVFSSNAMLSLMS